MAVAGGLVGVETVLGPIPIRWSAMRLVILIFTIGPTAKEGLSRRYTP